MRLYVNACDNEPPGSPACQPIRVSSSSQRDACRQRATMRPLRLSTATGFCFLSQLWHESANGGVSSLWAKG